jgi:DNA invertase Pin-like site-specific DNA recombinase
MVGMGKRAAIYCRISQDRAGAGLGVQRQREDCEAVAQRLGWQVVAVHTDNDLSAYSGKPRPGYRALLAQIAAGEIDAVLAWHEDRLHRSPRELEDYIDACEPRRVVTHFAQAGELDLTTASGRMTARIRGAVTRQESEHKSERVRRAQLQAAQAGRWLGGAPPFGWNLKDDGSATLDRAQAGIVRRAAADVLAGRSLTAIVADLNARGVTTSTGRAWNVTSLRQVLMRARNAGLVTLHGKVVGRSPWPVILTEDTWRAVCALLTDPSRRRSTSNRARWLLAGIALCETCGQPMRSAVAASNRAKGTTRTVYRCVSGGPGHVARTAEDVDALVEAVVIERLGRADAIETLAAPDRQRPLDSESLRVEAVALRARLGEAADLFAAGSITSAQLSRITADVNDRLADVEATMARSARGTALAPFLSRRDPAKVWAGLGLDERRALVRELMTVTIKRSGRRGNGFDPHLVDIAWNADDA